MLLNFEAFGGREPAMDPLEAIVAAFRDGAALVDAALQALALIGRDLDALRASTTRLDRDGRLDMKMLDLGMLDDAIASIRRHLDSATVSGDNLLVEDVRTRGGTLLVFGLSRQVSGAVTTQTIPIERDAIVLTGATPDAPRAFDHLVAAAARDGHGQLGSRVATMANQVAAAGSRLSIVKARVGLQSSFIKAVATSGMADLSCQLGSDLDQSGIRDLALATKRLLSRKALDIGSGNRQVLQTLFARHTAEITGT